MQFRFELKSENEKINDCITYVKSLLRDVIAFLVCVYAVHFATISATPFLFFIAITTLCSIATIVTVFSVFHNTLTFVGRVLNLSYKKFI
jgi:hypothetical protein